MENLTEIIFILDRSGSMSGLEKDTIGGFNSMLGKHKNSENAALVSTVLFDHESEVIHDRLPISEVPTLTEKEYFVRGNTALLDAMGDAIKHIKNIHKYARPEDVPAKTIQAANTVTTILKNLSKLKKKKAGTSYLWAQILMPSTLQVIWEFPKIAR